VWIAYPFALPIILDKRPLEALVGSIFQTWIFLIIATI
jgi:hypothetical protein